jgi:hypothetical protein
LSGLIAQLNPDSGGSVSNSFDAMTFNRTGSHDEDFSIGNYTYTKTGTNTAQLTMQNSAPVSRTNDSPFDVSLNFTNQYQGTYTSDDDNGAISFAIVPLRVPTSLSKRKLVLHSDAGTNTTTIALGSNGTFTQKPSLDRTGISSAGTFLFWRYSPIADFVALAFTGADAGNVTELQLTFSSTSAGIYRITTWTGPGTVVGTDAGTFMMQ